MRAGISFAKLKGTDYLEDLCVGGRIILKWIIWEILKWTAKK
jgi:hypothetical protein